MANQPQDAEVKGDVFKHQDTTRSISMRFKNDIGTWIIPDSTHTFTAKVANDTGLIGSYPVEIQGNQIILPTSELTELPPNDGIGHYSLEIWESYNDADGKEQTAIYPTPGYRVNFTVEENIADKAGQLIKQIGFQDVVNAAVIQAGQNLVVGNTTTLDPGQKASVSQVYKNGKNVLNFFIPQGLRGFQGPAGKSFRLKKTFPSIQEMNDSKGEGFEDGDFTLISSNVNDDDNAKMYVWDGSQFNYVGDLSGAQGMQGPVGPAPVIVVGTVTIGKPGTQPSVTFEKVDGGYKANFVIPQGEKGEKGDAPVRGKDYWTPEDQQAIKDDVTKTVGDAFAKAKNDVEDLIENGKW